MKKRHPLFVLLATALLLWTGCGKSPVPATTLTLSQTTLELDFGASFSLTLTVEPAEAAEYLTWASSDESVATVSGDGLVTGVGTGSATVSVTSPGGLIATCAVTVREPVPVESLILSRHAVTLLPGNSYQLEVSIIPSGATDRIVTWSSSDESIATVSTGLVTGVSEGWATITVQSASGASDSCLVLVSDGSTTVAVESITLSPSSLTLSPGESVTLLPSIYPENASYPYVEWRSSDPSVVSVDEKGNLKALSLGEATITCTSLDNVAIYAECHVTVTYGEESVQQIIFDQDDITLRVGEETDLHFTILPPELSYVSLEILVYTPTVAQVVRSSSDSITIRGISPGECQIALRTLDRSAQSLCRVTVTE